MDWLNVLRCPATKREGFAVSYVGERLAANGLPVEGYLTCEAAGTVYGVHGGIADLTTRTRAGDLTAAGWSNHVPPTPQLYERVWRRRSLSILTGEAFPVARELDWLNEWTGAQGGEKVIDLGTSTGLYARGLAQSSATIFAVDLAWGMLEAARGEIERELPYAEARNIVLMRAAAENLPFRDGSVDAVVVGGSLNEMKSSEVALAEARRVVRPGGRMVVMGLTRAASEWGRNLQGMIGASGIRFPSAEEFDVMARRAGWQVKRQEQKGVVLFCELRRKKD